MKYLAFMAGIVILSVPSHADIFHCTNDQGQIIFKDSACDGDESLVEVVEANVPPVEEANLVLGKNLVKNSAFADQLVDWRVPLGTSWVADGGFAGGGALVIQAEKPPDDKYIHETTVEQCIVLGAGEKFELSARFRSSIPPTEKHANRANVVWYESADCTTGGQHGGYIEPDTSAGWQRLSNKRLIPALGAKAALVTIVQNGRYSNNSKAYWDDISFAAIELFQQSAGNIAIEDGEAQAMAVGANYVINGNFDEDVDSWRVSTGWPAVWSDAEGDGAVRVTASSETGSIGRGAFSQCVNIAGNRRFDLGGSFKKDEQSTQGGGGRLRVTWYEQQNCSGRAKTDTNSADPQDVSGWQQLYASGLTIPPNAQSVIVSIIQTVDGRGEFVAYWDNLYLKVVE